MRGGKCVSNLVAGAAIILAIVGATVCLENLSLTQVEKQKLEQLKQAISSINFPIHRMKEELNLVRYLRARRWDVPGAKDMLLQTVKWWKDNNMDEIHTEDWSSVAKEYPINTDGVDRNGQPVFVFSIGDWDLRRAALQGKLDLAIRHFIKGFDEVHVKSIEYNKSGKSNGTQWNFISNLDKLSRQQHLCIPCLRFYTGIMLMFESHYPGSTEKIFVINAPSIFSVILTLVQPILSPETYKALQILGTNKEQWGPILFSHIAKDQLPESVGGSRT